MSRSTGSRRRSGIMSSERVPSLLLTLAAGVFSAWGVTIVLSPGGSAFLEWAVLVIGVALVVFGLVSLRSRDPKRAKVIRWLLTAFAVFGAAVVIGLTADDNSSRTWVRVGWAALLVGFVTSLAAWWGAPGLSRRALIGGGVVGAIVIAAGAGITLNCDLTLQRSWCDPAFEQEETLAARFVVDGAPDRDGRAGGDTGAYIRAHFIEGTDIEAVTTAPEPFRFEERAVQSTEMARGRYTAADGPYANCQVDGKVESVPAGNLQTLTVSCASAG